MALTAKTKKILEVAMANRIAAKELADAVDGGSAGLTEVIAALKALTAKMDLDPDLTANDWHDVTDGL